MERIREIRMVEWMISAGLLFALVVIVAPHMVSVIMAKGSLVTLGGLVGYGFDRRAFPSLRPHDCREHDRPAAQIRRALMVVGFAIAFALGA
jgi:hypothetical protein